MAKKVPATLRWSAEDSHYIWQKDGNTEKRLELSAHDTLCQLLDEYASFSFQGQQGHLNLLKETRVRGGDGYWYAYRRQGKRVVKKYAGRSADLTTTRLEELALTMQAESIQSEPAQELHKPHPQPTQSQQPPLLAPKLHLPRPTASLLARERLLARLDDGLLRKLTLIQAPAGFGKTTLVSNWIETRHKHDRSSPQVAWVALDEGDNDPIRFWHYLIVACQAFQPNLGESVLPLLHIAQRPPFPHPSLETILTGLLNELADLTERGILVLEDYHAIHNSEIHQTMSFFLEHQPASLHLLLMTRAEPPLPLAQLRAHDELLELGASQLRFTQDETRDFLRQTLPFPLEDSLLDLLQRRTEGWITGLRLLTLALQGDEAFSAHKMEQRLANISGSQRHILDYLVADVLSSQEEPLQTFLLQTTGLARLTGSLCDTVTGRADSTLLLEQIERANLFLLPIDESGTWYRYHALFAEAMQHEARRRLGEESLLAIASKASHWYEQHDMLYEAVESALGAHEVTRAAALMTRIVESENILQHQELHTFLRWLRQFPEEILRTSPTLSETYAMVIPFTAHRHLSTLKPQFEKYLQMAEDRLRTLGDLPRLGEVLALHALLSKHVNDQASTICCAQEALKLLPEEKKYWRSLALSLLGISAIFAGRVSEARQLMHEAGKLKPVSYENSYTRSSSLVQQGYLALGAGHLEQATLLMQQVLDIAVDDRSDQGTALLLLATICYEWNRLAEAEQYIQQAYTVNTEAGDELLCLQSAILQARMLYARGEHAQALNYLQLLATGLAHPRFGREVELWLARFALASGDLLAAQRRLAGLRTLAQNDSPADIAREQEDLLAARLLIAQGEEEQVHKALDILTYWRAEAQSQTRFRSEVEILLIMAQAYERLRRGQEAKEALKEALSLAQSAGYQRLFLDEGADMAALLKGIAAEVRAPLQVAFLRTLLRSFTTNQPSKATTDSDDLLKALSTQERRVLNLLVAGRTNPEIASELVVSLNTVKTQVKSIYRKLDIGSRHEASEVARRLGLI
ncbi:hypothetical protein EPA93_12160 [Ktedonosporobacter rubrisoli]|uniref:HTH luxR-type domain-containing protein n=1 Tax=Ktedonosporobacter rubrisoli TaxID=2509675 RepID=A0A4P6JN40_KTERU|nr:LuxR C-terminal-related transcriptional regulator [Ktedonosporobacter rubrisoli]QBD76717.1 hypothetical protein EPA93_12160 [Ktedonosporobacter rubrisoli]